MSNTRIVIVEDECIIAMQLSAILTNMGYMVEKILSDAQHAISYISTHGAELVLMDIMLQGHPAGIDAAGLIYKEKSIPVILMSAHDDHDMIKKAARSHAYGFVKKPVDENTLRIQIELALQHARTQQKHTSKTPATAVNRRMNMKKLPIWKEDEIHLVDMDDLLYLEIQSRDLHFVTRQNHFIQKGTLAEWEDKLHGLPFYRCHKSYIVNIKHIESIISEFNNTYSLRFKNRRETIPLSRNKVSKLKDFLFF